MIGLAGRQHRNMVALAIQPSRKIVVAGDATLGNGFSGGFARYKNAGKVDESFGEHGRVFSRFRYYAGIRALVYQRERCLRQVTFGRCGPARIISQ